MSFFRLPKMGEDVEMTEEPKDEGKFVLSAVVEAHKGDIRAMVTSPDGLIISGSRDEPIKLWGKRAGEFDVRTQFMQDRSANIIAIALYEANDKWYLFAGRRDGVIYVYSKGSTAPAFQWSRHSASISCLHADNKSGVLLSGSWDNSAVVWPLHNEDPASLSLQLVGHSLSVWTVSTIPDKTDFYLTGSADKLIKLWHKEVNVRTYTGHTDVVRVLVPLSSTRFLSAANDSTIRLWNIDSEAAIAKFHSVSDHYIYTMSMKGNHIVTSGEGGLIEVWKLQDGVKEKTLKNAQQIAIPSPSVWSVAFMSDDEFAAAASDGHLYVYTTNKAKAAKPDILAAYDAAIANQQRTIVEQAQQESKTKIVRIKVSLDDGPPTHVLEYEKGTDPTITAEKFIQDYDLPASYLDEIVDYMCNCIPEAKAARDKKMLKNILPMQKVKVGDREYDYAFQILVAEDGRKLVVAFNVGDDPDYVAQKFVEQHNLPIGYLAKVGSMIRSQTQKGTQQNFADPFTGGGRHVPMDESAGFQAGYDDPFTGGGRYVPGQSGSSGGEGFDDPYTSGGRYKPGSAAHAELVPNASQPADKKKPRSEYVPLREFFMFGVEQLSQKAIAKLRELNEKQEAFQLNPEQMEGLERLMMGPTDLSVSLELLTSALDIGMQWSLEDVVPILDLFRIALLHKELNEYYCNVKTRGLETLDKLTTLLISEPPDPLRILICRVATNACAHQWGKEMLTAKMSEIVPLTANQFKSPKAAIQLASASALANWSLLLLQKSDVVQELGPREDIIRAIVALAKQRNIGSIVGRMKDAVVEESAKNVARDIVEMTHAV
ncbi:hypothetical protein WR25_16369 [Diploscapter pachys]|uniref:PUL domain-containing protein n=1 Tax=Diploscapter pachys TaxID=2018661 RepID=A0A2A2KVB6_9BILA|nr:hypothetical protein WR25_16369 [Diploscapter pachys]